MLEDYKDSQKYAYGLIRNSIVSGEISHAYLINSNNNPYAFDFVMAMVKAFICPKNFLDNGWCNDCSLCNRIDDGNYPELKIIDSDGLWIKKNQILDLQDDFSKIALEGNKRIYVIKDADRMNLQTSNSILKFLEEPSNNVIAILITNNINKMLKTIISRCQVVNLQVNAKKGDNEIQNFAYISCNSSKEIEDLVEDDNVKKFIDSVLNFIIYYEEQGTNVIVYSKQYWHSKFKDKNSVIKVLDLMINFYYDILWYKYGGRVNFFVEHVDLISKLAFDCNVEKIIKKINVLIENKDKLLFNVNLNLFFDKLIIELGGGYDECCRS